jgi:hypothetical protein
MRVTREYPVSTGSLLRPRSSLCVGSGLCVTCCAAAGTRARHRHAHTNTRTHTHTHVMPRLRPLVTRAMQLLVPWDATLGNSGPPKGSETRRCRKPPLLYASTTAGHRAGASQHGAACISCSCAAARSLLQRNGWLRQSSHREATLRTRTHTHTHTHARTHTHTLAVNFEQRKAFLHTVASSLEQIATMVSRKGEAVSPPPPPTHPDPTPSRTHPPAPTRACAYVLAPRARLPRDHRHGWRCCLQSKLSSL